MYNEKEFIKKEKRLNNFFYFVDKFMFYFTNGVIDSIINYIFLRSFVF